MVIGLDASSLPTGRNRRAARVPLARLELGAVADSFDRYARLAPDGDVVTVAEFEVQRQLSDMCDERPMKPAMSATKALQLYLPQAGFIRGCS